MAYKPHTLVAFGGVLDTAQTPGEIWQCGIRVVTTGGSGDGLPLPNPQQYADGLAPLLSSWFGLTNHRIPSVARLDYVKVNNIGADGKYVDPVTHIHTYSPGIPGGSVATVPSILCCVLSWSTAHTRGPGARGRIYPPNFAAAQFTPGSSRILASDITALTLSGQDLLQAIVGGGGASDLELMPVVASRVNATNTPITGVRVGNVWDVQRRRKDAVPEAYTSLPFPP